MTDTELQAGRELDAIVAEKVMGWERSHDMPPFAHLWFAPRDTESAMAKAQGAVYKSSGAGGTRPAFPVPRYSTDIAAAWLVVDRIRPTDDTRYGVTIESAVAGWYCTIEDADVEWDDPAHTSVAYGETLPLAICRAALASAGAA
jgi:hypothetical protein